MEANTEGELATESRRYIQGIRKEESDIADSNGLIVTKGNTVKISQAIQKVMNKIERVSTEQNLVAWREVMKGCYRKRGLCVNSPEGQDGKIQRVGVAPWTQRET